MRLFGIIAVGFGAAVAFSGISFGEASSLGFGVRSIICREVIAWSLVSNNLMETLKRIMRRIEFHFGKICSRT